MRTPVTLRFVSCFFALLVSLFGVSTDLLAQMVGIQTPLQTQGDSFFESTGVGWGYTNNNFNFSFNAPAIPPFGGYDPSAGARLGFAGRAPGGGRFRFGLTMAQGSSRTSTLQSPSLVVPNGGGGFIGNGSFQPFVTSYIPVVGDQGPPTSVANEVLNAIQSGETMESLLARHGSRSNGSVSSISPSKGEPTLNAESASSERVGPFGRDSSRRSSAERGDISVAEIVRQQQVIDRKDEIEKVSEVAQLLDRAQTSEEAGKLTLAKYCYRTAIRKATLAHHLKKAEAGLDRVTQLQAIQRAEQLAARAEREKRRKSRASSTIDLDKSAESRQAD